MARLAMDPNTAAAFAAGLSAATDGLATNFAELFALLGPPQPAEAFDGTAAVNQAWTNVANFFFDPRLQWDENGNVLLDPKGDPLPDNLWTQFVAVQATLIKRLNETLAGAGVPQSFGFAVATYTLLIRAFLYPFVKGQLETTAKIQVLAPRVNELKEKYKDDEERLQQEVGLLYMDLNIDPLAAILPVLFQLPVFWGLYRAIRRLAIVEYEPLKDQFLWIPSLYGPNFTPDPSFNWLTQWKGPLIELHPTIGWESFGLFAILPLTIFFSYKVVLSEATADKDSPKLLQFLPFMLAFITVELPQAMGIYIATNIASSLAITNWVKNQIQAKIPGYDEFVETGKWPPGVDPEKVLAKAFGVQRIASDGTDLEDPTTVPEAIFSGRADCIPSLLEGGRTIDEFDDRGIQASAYTIALSNVDLMKKLFDLGADPRCLDKRGNTLFHYCAGYGQKGFVPVLLEIGLKDMLNQPNEDGQTALDVARMNLSQEKVAEGVREVIGLLEEAGAEGKVTTKEDEARIEAARDAKKKEDSINAARSALMALAAQGKPGDSPAEGAKAEESSEAPKDIIAGSLNRIKALDMEKLKERLGGKMSEEQMKKLQARLEKMTPEELAKYTADGQVASAEPEPAGEEETAHAKEESANAHAKEEQAAHAAPAPVPVPAPSASNEKKVSVIVD